MKFFKIFSRLLKEELMPELKNKKGFKLIFEIIYTIFFYLLLPLTFIGIFLLTIEEYLKCKKKKED